MAAHYGPRILWIAISGPRVRTNSGSPISPMWPPGTDSSTLPSSPTFSPGGSSVGGCPAHFAVISRSTPSRWLCGLVARLPTASFTIPIAQYTSIAFGNRCKQAGVRPSTGSVGDCFDNAMCESFFATLECELLDRKRFRTQAEARMAVFEFLEGWYNPHRRHSGAGNLSPMEYEKQHAVNA